MPNTKQSEETKIALIGNNIGFIQTDIAEIKDSIKGLNTIFASKEQLTTVTRETEARLVDLESSSNFWKIMTPALTAILASVMTFLIIQYLTNVCRGRIC